MATTSLISTDHKPAAFITFWDGAASTREEVRCHVTMMDFRPLNGVKPCHDIGFRPDDPSYNVLSFFQRLSLIEKIFPCLKFVLMDGLDLISASTSTSISTSSTSGNRGQRVVRNRDMETPTESSIKHPQSDYWTRPHRLETAMNTESVAKFQPILLSGAQNRYIHHFLHNPTYATNLLYLDISRQLDNIPSVFSAPTDCFPNLKILKLRGMRLKTNAVSILLKQIQLRVFSLDLRDNQLTDDIVQMLLANNIRSNLPQRTDLHSDAGGERRLSSNTVASIPESLHQERYMEEPPSYRERANPLEEQETMVADGRVEMRLDDADGVIAHLTRDEQIAIIRTNGLPLETDDLMLKTGITHLYLSNNNLTSDGVNQLLQGTNRLQLLDVGGVVQSKHRLAAKNPNIKPICQADTVRLLGPEYSQRLESLRIHHSIVTHTPTLGTVGEFHLSEARHVQLSEEDYAGHELVAWPEALLPNINPRIRSLTLTNVPRKSHGQVIERLLNFLHEASLQESLIEDLAPVDRRRGARMLSGLRVLRLEFESLYVRREQLNAGPSVSEDADADKFMAESERDFSFFQDYAVSPVSTVKDFSFFDDETPAPRGRSISSTSKQSKDKDKERPLLRDVEQEIRSYREKTKAAYEAEKDRFEAEREEVGGAAVRVPLGAPHYHWTGLVEIVVSVPS